MKICLLYFLLNCVCSAGFAGLGLLKGEETCKVEWVGLAQSGLLDGVCWSWYTWWVCKVEFVKWGLQIGSGLLGWVCSIKFAGFRFMVWVHWEGESLANWGLQCGGCEVDITMQGFLGWGFLGGVS